MLNLVVLRSADLATAEQFYNAVGLKFERHRHGSGPEHLACDQKGIVFEIYPLADGADTTATRVGFRVDDVDETVKNLSALGADIHRRAADSPWGRRAVVRDFDGHLVEITS